MQTTLEVTLTGFMRFQIVKEWFKRGADGDKEAFVKRVCEAKSIIYVPAKGVKR